MHTTVGSRGYWRVRAKHRKIGSFRASADHASFVTEEETRDLLGGDPEVAEKRAREALEADAADPQALLLLAGALRRKHDCAVASAILQPLVCSQPQMGFAWRELGLCLVDLGQTAQAQDSFLHAVDLNYLDRDAWLGLNDVLDFSKHEPQEDSDHSVQLARQYVRDCQFEEAEGLLKQLLEAEPQNSRALKLLATIHITRNRWSDAKQLLERGVILSPGSAALRFCCATMLLAHRHYLLALPHIGALVGNDSQFWLYRALKGFALSRSRQFELAALEYESILKGCDDRPGLWLEYARVLRILQRKSAIEAFKKAIELLPSFVEAYVALAFVKTLKLDDFVVTQASAQLARPTLTNEDRARLHYVLGKAFEDTQSYSQSFEHYRRSNEILCSGRTFGPEVTTDFKRRTKRFVQRSFLSENADAGAPATAPIFIVGLPRSGSTLVEQILASHSAIEALGELSDLGQIVRGLANEGLQQNRPYPQILRKMDSNRFQSLGEEYLAAVQRRRKTYKAHFTDKMPANFAHIPLISLMFPNAKIIDTRRHPLDCCFSCFKHYFPAGQPLSTNLRDVGRSYAEYVELMAYFDDLMPGRVHRVFYEQLIEDPLFEVRRLLAYIGVPFEEQCLHFHENDRLVMTISADQVRMPLYRSGMGQWRFYEQWLSPLKEELGYVMQVYPQVPQYFPEIRGRYSDPLHLGQSTNPFSIFRGVQQLSFDVRSQRAILAESQFNATAWGP